MQAIIGTMNHREVLGIGQNASAGEIKQAFRQAAKEVHPDISNSPEAAEAFARIKEAHDALLKEAETPRESTTVQAATARSAAATGATAFQQPADDPKDAAAVTKTQALDEAARKKYKLSFFGRRKEPTEVKKHRKKLKTNERRLRGLY